jgi:ketosteroid isomerase-like protein
MNRLLMIRPFALLCALLCLLAASAVSQDCSESKIRTSVENRTDKGADDEFFWSGAFDRPLVGKAALEQGMSAVGAKRKNWSQTSNAERIVVSKSGDMAYEYGTSSVSFDDPDGKHVAFQAGYLRVWKSVEGQCRIAAMMARPYDR